MAQKFKVEVVYTASAVEQKQVELEVDLGASVLDAIIKSRVLEIYPEINLSKNKVGIFSKPVKLEQPLNEGDRVEIYRPLLIDPKDIRKKRASERK